MASSSIVIKVRYGETLRRLNASINEKKLVFDMVMLKEKIRKLFSFGSDVECTMTYADEDGDEVTLADDDDLRDIARQSLNPLRITVSLNSSNFNGPSGNSTPLKSPQNQSSLLEAFAKLSPNMASEASSAPAAAEHVQKKAVYSNPVLPSMASPRVHPATDGHPSVNPESSTVKNSKVQVISEAGGSSSKKKEKQVQKVAESSPEHLNQGRQVQADQWLHFGDYMMAQGGRLAQTAAGLKKITNDSGSCSGWAQGMWNQANQCPFSGMPLTRSDSHSQRHHYGPWWKRDHRDNNDTGNVFHWGIICDGCEANPITGPRFKSKVKFDYDLCNVCFAAMGNATDYIRMDKPTNSFKHPFTLLPPTMRTPGLKHFRSKLDSRFILDVNVLDGTILAPFTAFTKIWRMRNSGSIAWPYGSQLQWIGGDGLSKSLFVDVEIPIHGLPVEKEVDISVDFTAPELPGRYVSYWRMSSPSGEKFGQRVWVLIQVEAPVGAAPPETASSSVFNPAQVGAALGSLKAGSMVTSGSSSEPISYPTVDFSVMPPVMSSGAASLPTVVVQPPVPPSGSGSQVASEASEDKEEALVKELEAMGFMNKDLNKEILRMNGYNLDKAVDDLCGVLEWDPMLDELREMGFGDEKANRRLLKKNNGSIKGVVMDLINEEKA